MQYNSGLSKTITNLLRCQDNIYDAIRFWSAGVIYPRRHDKLDKLHTWLSAEGYTCYEFLLYITNASKQDLDNKTLQGLHAAAKKENATSEFLLCRHNAWASRQEVVDGFVAWKRRRDEELTVKYSVLKEAFKRKAEVHGYPMTYTLLDRKFVDGGAVFTMDIALEHKEYVGDKIKDLIDKYSPWTMLILMGCPEYFKHCPYLKDELEENVDGIQQLIFSPDW